jgi:transcriptional regulator with XRE-family HTH domain
MVGSPGKTDAREGVPTPVQLGQVVRRLRVEREMTLEALAKVAELHWTYLSGIERGRRNPTLNVLAAVARSLDTKTAKLVSLAEETRD